MCQLDLFGEPWPELPVPPAAEDTAGRQWHTVEVPDTAGAAAYLIVMRADGDPERSPRPEGGRDDRAPHRTLGRTSPEDWFAIILTTLGEIGEATMHRLSVHILDKDSSIVFQTPFEEALWELIRRGEIEMTWEAPILFRVRSEATAAPVAARKVDDRYTGDVPF